MIAFRPEGMVGYNPCRTIEDLHSTIDIVLK